MQINNESGSPHPLEIQVQANHVSGLRKLRRSEEVYQYVVSAITTGHFSPAQKITERELAAELKISHVPVREAMERLAQHGWIERTPWRGTYVKHFDFNKLEAAYQLREIVEIGAIHVLARQITPDQLVELGRVVNMLEEAREREDTEGFKQADTQFHKLLVSFTGNSQLAAFHESVILQAGAYFMLFLVGVMKLFAKMGKPLDYLQAMSHKDIFEALAKHDEQKAVCLLQKHFQRSQEVLQKMARVYKEFGELEKLSEIASASKELKS
jgi:GntR family transcriptional regulator, rspAB operon transcriptional repressor